MSLFDKFPFSMKFKIFELVGLGKISTLHKCKEKQLVLKFYLSRKLPTHFEDVDLQEDI